MSGATLNDLLALAVRFRDERDWKQFHSPKELAIQLMLESAELLELMQWRNGPDLLDHLDKRKEDLADELADVLHSVLLIADEMQIDLARAFEAKMKKNAQKYPVHKAKGSAKKYHEL
jgi:dCTP diphosphatase